ncbi:MAG: Wzz/FepE/Etk N-terminal domain-containing protein [Nautiliaceae bacterium]
MNKEEKVILPTPYYYPCEEDEIDLKELIKTMLKYKKFIFAFTFSITILAAIYAFLKKPIYQIKANLELGYFQTITEKRGVINIPFIQTETAILYINSTYNAKDSYPKVTASKVKKASNIIQLSIEDFSNKKALNDLNTILNDIKSMENKKINFYKKAILSKISILENQKKYLQKQINLLSRQLSLNNNPSIVDTLLSYQDKLLSIKLKIASLKEQISPLSIHNTQIIGKIEKDDNPVKPKKKLIIVVAFVTSFILSIFLIFFIEFIKSFKDD